LWWALTVKAIRTKDDRLSDASFATFARWPDVYGIYLNNTAVTGIGFDKFAGHSHLEQVSLFGPNVNDDGVRAVSRLRHVTHLQIGNSWENRAGKYHLHYAIVTDRALAAIGSMEKLAYLEIENADITDEGIQQLAAMKSAVDIQFYRCKGLTQKGLESLRMALPNATIRAHVPEL
jgi:hypothetical protein